MTRRETSRPRWVLKLFCNHGLVGSRNANMALRQRDTTGFLYDCDEIADDTLAAAIKRVMAETPNPRDGFNVVRRDEFYGKLMLICVTGRDKTHLSDSSIAATQVMIQII